MSDDPWAAFPQADQGQPDPWAAFPAADAPSSYSGSILPLTRDASGVHFDSNAGIVGMGKRVAQGIWSGVTAPGDAATGKLQTLDPETGMPTEEGMNRAGELAGVISPVNPAVTAGSKAIPGMTLTVRPSKVAAPTAEELRAAASQGYDAVRDAGVDYSSSAVAQHAANLQRGLEADGILDVLAPNTHNILQRLQQPPAGSVAPIAGVEAARRALRGAAQQFTNPTEQLAATRAIQGLDRFIEAADPATVVAGPAADAGRALVNARGNYAASARSNQLNGIEEAGELRAAAANSGANGDNSIRQRVVSLLLNDKKRAGFNADEIAGLNETARGTFPRNTIRTVGNLLGGGGGLGAVVTGAAGAAGGAAAAGGIGAAAGVAAPVVGYGAKQLADALTHRSLRGVDEMTRMRSPLYEERAAAAGTTAVSPQARAALIRALMQDPRGATGIVQGGMGVDQAQ